MSQTITISELTPNTKGNFTLKFEVAEVATPLTNSQQVECKIVDETGCIDAFFNNFGKYIKVGGVYELVSFKCKVVQHSMRVQLRKDSKLTRIKHEFSFKDLFNNLSEKFYVSKQDQKNKDPIQKGDNGTKIQEINNLPSRKQDEIKKEQKVETKKKQVQQTKATKNGDIKQQNAGPKKNKKILAYKEKQEKKNNFQSQPPKKKLYVPKNSHSDQQGKQAKKVERENQQQTTLLKDIHNFQQQSVNLIARILFKTKIDCDKYQLIKICDISGAVFAEFVERVDVQEEAWYSLKNFKVYGDKKYGFVVCQTKQSSWEILYDYNEKPNFKELDFKKQ